MMFSRALWVAVRMEGVHQVEIGKAPRSTRSSNRKKTDVSGEAKALYTPRIRSFAHQEKTDLENHNAQPNWQSTPLPFRMPSLLAAPSRILDALADTRIWGGEGGSNENPAAGPSWLEQNTEQWSLVIRGFGLCKSPRAEATCETWARTPTPCKFPTNPMIPNSVLEMVCSSGIVFIWFAHRITTPSSDGGFSPLATKGLARRNWSRELTKAVARDDVRRMHMWRDDLNDLCLSTRKPQASKLVALALRMDATLDKMFCLAMLSWRGISSAQSSGLQRS